MQRADHEQWKSSEVARLLALVETERRYYQDIFAILPVAVALVDVELRLTAINREFRRRFGLQFTDLSAVRLPDLIPDPALESAMADVLATGAPKRLENLALGNRLLHIAILKTQGWQDGSDDELLLAIEEATAKVEPVPPLATEEEPAPPPAVIEAPPPDPALLRRQLEEAKRGGVERLAARLAHVSNNLLMIIGGYADEILETFEEGDSRRDDLGEILKASNRLAALAKDLNVLTRPPAFDLVDFDAQPWLQAMAARFHLGAEPPETPFRLHASPLLAEQILAEFLRYLKPHLPPEPRLLLTGQPVEGEARLTVRVLEAELPAEVGERIFEPFSGAKEGSDPPLGLAGLVRPWQVLGGTLDYDPATATLLLTAPLAAAAPEPEPEPEPIVLLVEDEPGIRSLIVKNLERQGYHVVHAGSPGEALLLHQELPHPPELLVTDLMVPGMTGGALARHLREAQPELRVLFISGYTSDTDLASRIASGNLEPGTRFLAKPFTASQLLAEIRALLQSPAKRSMSDDRPPASSSRASTAD